MTKRIPCVIQLESSIILDLCHSDLGPTQDSPAMISAVTDDTTPADSAPLESTPTIMFTAEDTTSSTSSSSSSSSSSKEDTTSETPTKRKRSSLSKLNSSTLVEQSAAATTAATSKRPRGRPPLSARGSRGRGSSFCSSSSVGRFSNKEGILTYIHCSLIDAVCMPLSLLQVATMST